MGFLALLFLVVGVAELLVLVLVEELVGTAATVGLILVAAVAGAYLMTSQGLGVIRAARADFQRGVFPGRRVAEGAMILVGGAFLFTPGFLTDAMGLLLMAPPVRSVLWRWGKAYFGRRLRLR